MSDLQRDMGMIEGLVNGEGSPVHAACWQRIRARLTPDRERVIEAVREAYLSATNATGGLMLSEDYAVVADAAIKAMGVKPCAQ